LRTDEHNNPTAFTVNIAKQAKLREGIDYEQGNVFPDRPTFATARLLGDPILQTIKVIDALGFYTQAGIKRWDYIGMPKFIWLSLAAAEKRDVVGFMYQKEGGTLMRHLFPNYGSK
jgi:hypothetical protein